MVEKLRNISQKSLKNLRNSIEENLALYQGGDFDSYPEKLHWDMELTDPEIDYDTSLLKTLVHVKGKSIIEQDLTNSLIVGKALINLTPTLACEEVIWTRLCHIDALAYCRSRWFPKKPGFLASTKQQKNYVNSITTHMFCPTATAVRDDNAISRLWWNFRIAKLAMPSEPERAMRQILKTADIRSNLIERPYTGARSKLLRGIVLFMEKTPKVSKDETKFRGFCKNINSSGVGLIFEEMDDINIQQFCEECWAKVI